MNNAYIGDPAAPGIISLFSRPGQANRSLTALQQDRHIVWRLSLLVPRQTIRQFLGRMGASPQRGRFPTDKTIIRRGPLTGLLGLTAGIGSRFLPDLGPTITTGLFARLLDPANPRLDPGLEKLNLAAKEILLVKRQLLAGGILVATQHEKFETIDQDRPLIDRLRRAGAVQSWPIVPQIVKAIPMDHE